MNSLRYICGMRPLRRIFDFYINSSIHVAIAVCAFTGISYHALNLEKDIDLFGFIFFGTITGYNFVKYAGIAKLHHYRLSNSLKILQVFSLFCFLFSVFFAFRLPYNTLIACIPLGLLTLFYAVPITSKKNNLRTLPSLKIFVIAAVWAGTTVYLPVIHNDHGIVNGEVWILIVRRFLLVLALILPFEIRDVTYDAIGLRTFPQILGIKKTKFSGYLLLTCFLALSLWKNTLGAEKWITPLLLFFMTFLAIYFAKEKHGRYYCSFWVEGIPIFAWILYLFI